jgi:hypothetical protein
MHLCRAFRFKVTQQRQGGDEPNVLAFYYWTRIPRMQKAMHLERCLYSRSVPFQLRASLSTVTTTRFDRLIMTNITEKDKLLLYHLLPTKTSIRLLKLCRVKANFPLQASLSPADLDHDPDFQALSYTWGDPLTPSWATKVDESPRSHTTMICNGTVIDVTINLEAALRAMVDRRVSSDVDEDQFLWVDAICINQDDTSERNAQVAMMHRIYSQAAMVICWLGPLTTADVCNGTGHIQLILGQADKAGIHLGDQIQPQTIVEAFRGFPQTFTSIAQKILSRQYFSRSWILQEVILAKACCFVCGSQELSFRDLATAGLIVGVLGRYASEGPKNRSTTVREGHGVEEKIHTLFLQRESMQQGGQSMSFSRLLEVARATDCSDPRDKVFATQGLIAQGNGSRARIAPDYRRSILEVYTEAVRLWIQERRSLDILSWVVNEPYRRYPDLPTWVGEFESVYRKDRNLSLNAPAATDGSCASLGGFSYQEQRQLSVQGVQVGHIEHVADLPRWSDAGVSFDTIWTDYPRLDSETRTRVQLDAEETPVNDAHHLVDSIRQQACVALLREVHMQYYFTDIRGHAAGPHAPPHRAQAVWQWREKSQGGCVISQEELQRVKILSCDCRGVTYGHSTQWSFYSRYCPYIMDLLQDSSMWSWEGFICSPISPQSIDPRSTELGRRMYNPFDTERLAKVSNGSLAIIPASSQRGDVVFLLEGASKPFVLRQVSSPEEVPEKVPRWEVVGDAHVHGAMDGQIWKETKHCKCSLVLV